METNLLKFLINKIYIGGYLPIFILLLLFKSIEGLVILFVEYYNFKLFNQSTDSQSVFYHIIYITIFWTIKKWMSYINFIIIRKWIYTQLYKYFYNSLLIKFFIFSDIEWLNIQNTTNIYNAIDSGVDSMVETTKFFLDILNPFFQTLSTIYIIYTFIGNKIIIIIPILLSIFAFGFIILRIEYIKRKIINKKSNPLKSDNNYYTENFINFLLNGNGEKTVDKIISNSIYSKKENVKITLWVENLLHINELYGYCCMLLIIYLLFSWNYSPKLIISSYFSINNCLNNTWWLFHLCNSASNEISKWSSLQVYIETYIEKKIKPKHILYEFTIHNSNAGEYWIKGESGSGKTTWIKNQLFQLFNTYNVSWIYLNQNMKLIHSSKMTIFEYFNENYNFKKTVLLEWAKKFKLESIINSTTIYRIFHQRKKNYYTKIFITSFM